MAVPGHLPCQRRLKMILTKRFSLIVIMLLAFASVFAQTAKTKMNVSKEKTVFACTHCNMADEHAAKCGMCKMDMMKMKANVMYHCDHCKKDTLGTTCPTCKGKTMKMAVAYTCDHCKTSSTKMGKCPKCKMDMTKHTMKMKS